MQHSETEDVDLQKFQLVKKKSTQLKEGIVSNLILIYVVVIKLSLSLYGIIVITQIYVKE